MIIELENTIPETNNSMILSMNLMILP